MKDLKKLAHTSTTTSPKCAENTCAANAAPAYAGFNIAKAFVLVYLVAVSYYAGTNCTQAKKDYEAACLFKDIINSSMDMGDDFGREAQNHYDEWVMDFEALKLTNLQEKDLDTYYWCY